MRCAAGLRSVGFRHLSSVFAHENDDPTLAIKADAAGHAIVVVCARGWNDDRQRPHRHDESRACRRHLTNYGSSTSWTELHGVASDSRRQRKLSTCPGRALSRRRPRIEVLSSRSHGRRRGSPVRHRRGMWPEETTRASGRAERELSVIGSTRVPGVAWVTAWFER